MISVQHEKTIIGFDYVEIEDPLTNESPLPKANYTGVQEDGSFTDYKPLGPFAIIPIGNWDFIGAIFQRIHNETGGEIEISNTDTEWDYSYVLLDNEIMLNTVEIAYSKEDGLLIKTIQIYDYKSNEKYIRYHTYRTEINEAQAWMPFGMGILAVSLAVIAIVIFWDKIYQA